MAVKEDIRIVRTRKLLCDALLDMMQTDSIEHISVIDICNKSLINRATFYKHFEDKYDLLAYALEEIKREINRGFIINKSDLNTPQDALRALFTTTTAYFFDNRSRVSNLIKHNMHTKVISCVKDSIADSIESLVSGYTDTYALRVPLPVLATFLAGGLVSTLIWCLQQPGKYTFQEFATCIEAGCIDSLFEKV